MLFKLFDLKAPLPLSQGFAINEIAKQTAGNLVAAGEVTEKPKRPGTLLYVKKSYSEGNTKTSESVWRDDGCGVTCRYIRLNNQTWLKRKGNDWKPTDFILELK